MAHNGIKSFHGHPDGNTYKFVPRMDTRYEKIVVGWQTIAVTRVSGGYIGFARSQNSRGKYIMLFT